MADETKITLKMGLIASLVGSLVMFVMGCLWNYHGRLTILETDYKHVYIKLDRIETTVEAIRGDQVRREMLEKQKRRSWGCKIIGSLGAR